jgi:hypothetical protein
MAIAIIIINGLSPCLRFPGYLLLLRIAGASLLLFRLALPRFTFTNFRSKHYHSRRVASETDCNSNIGRFSTFRRLFSANERTGPF